MAAGDQRKSYRVVMEDKRQGYLVFNINIKHLFDARPRQVSLPVAAMEMRTLPSPIGQIAKLVDHPELIDFALTRDGAAMVGVSSHKRTFTYDTRSGVSSTGPELQHHKINGTYVILLGHRIYAFKCRLGGYDKAMPSGEVCDLPIPAGGGGASLRRGCSTEWRSLPEPPLDFRCLSSFLPTCQLTTYFTAGTRLWVSAENRGTYSLDTVRSTWRKEGDWELPFYYRALFVPELDNLCFNLCSKRRCLLAVDIEQSPPVVRYRWEETFPRWIHDDNGTNYMCSLMQEGSLVYLGGGRFCVAWTVGMHDPDDYLIRRRLIHVMAVQVIKTSTSSGEKMLRMIKHKVCCYKMPSHGQMAYVL